MFDRGDFVLLTDDMECSMVGAEDISLLEAHRKFTLVHLPDGKFLVRRSLKDCERRLDSSPSFEPAEAVFSTSPTSNNHAFSKTEASFYFKGRKRSRIVAEAIRSLP